jgi:hypothetical protein
VPHRSRSRRLDHRAQRITSPLRMFNADVTAVLMPVIA